MAVRTLFLKCPKGLHVYAFSNTPIYFLFIIMCRSVCRKAFIAKSLLITPIVRYVVRGTLFAAVKNDLKSFFYWPKEITFDEVNKKIKLWQGRRLKTSQTLSWKLLQSNGKIIGKLV